MVKRTATEDAVMAGMAVVYVDRTGGCQLAEVTKVHDGGVVTLRTLWGRGRWSVLNGVPRWDEGCQRNAWRPCGEVRDT